MQLNSMKAIGAAVWILVIAVIGLASNPTSLTSWILLAALAILPPLVVMRRWTPPRDTMSEIIREGRR
jgi:hypothetical protein